VYYRLQIACNAFKNTKTPEKEPSSVIWIVFFAKQQNHRPRTVSKTEQTNHFCKKSSAKWEWLSKCVCVGVRVYVGVVKRRPCKLLLGVMMSLPSLSSAKTEVRNLWWTGKVYLLPKKGGRQQRPTLPSMVKVECLIVFWRAKTQTKIWDFRTKFISGQHCKTKDVFYVMWETATFSV